MAGREELGVAERGPEGILCLNAGSSTLKATWFGDAGAVPRKSEAGGERAVTIDKIPSAEALDEALRGLGLDSPKAAAAVRAVGHRVVHGGVEFRGAVRIDAGVKAAMGRLSVLAPLHNPPALATIEAAEQCFPGVPHVAAFDTSFFAELPPAAYVYPLPYEWYEKWGVRRFGFHGLSHQYCAARAAEMLTDSRALRVIVLHLGNGCSGSAVVGGKPVATTMGFTPMEGLMMGTRGGSVDPGILLYAMREHGLDVEALDRALNHNSGLMGVSGISGDYREVESKARLGDDRAQLALEIYSDRARSAVGSLATAIGGLDALVFTAGVGEHSAALRAEVCHWLEFIGVRLDEVKNASVTLDADVSRPDSPVRVLVIRTREDLVVARETNALIGKS